MSAFHYRAEDAFHGPLGELAKRVEESIEVDSLTFLGQLLTAVGAMVGRRASIDGGYTPHHCNLFTLIVGETGIGKGSAWSLVQRFVEAVDPKFRERLASDVQSAPGLIQLVTDGTRRPAKKQRGTTPADWEWVVPPVEDKRLLLCNEEMQTVLTAKERRGATLGELLKQAWDGKTLENNAKDRLKATDPHVSLIGHITPADLKHSLGHSRRDRSNGYHNRFIFVQARRMRSLPFGGAAPDFDDLLAQVRVALDDVAARPLQLNWADDARHEWTTIYEACKCGDPFLSGLDGVRERLHCHIMRVAMLLAVMDKARAIHLAHLQAAKAICLPALDGCRDLFDGRSTDDSADDTLRDKLTEIVPELPPEFTASDIWKGLGNRGDRNDLNRWVAERVAAGEWVARSVRGGNNRDVTYYSVAKPPAQSPDEHVYDGHRMRLGQKFTVPRPISSLDLNDQVICVPAGATAFLVQNPENASDEERDWLAGWGHRKPGHRLIVLADGGPVLIPIKPCQDWAAAAAEF
jgi:hypothetical protein